MKSALLFGLKWKWPVGNEPEREHSLPNQRKFELQKSWKRRHFDQVYRALPPPTPPSVRRITFGERPKWIANELDYQKIYYLINKTKPNYRLIARTNSVVRAIKRASSWYRLVFFALRLFRPVNWIRAHRQRSNSKSNVSAFVVSFVFSLICFCALCNIQFFCSVFECVYLAANKFKLHINKWNAIWCSMSRPLVCAPHRYVVVDWLAMIMHLWAHIPHKICSLFGFLGDMRVTLAVMVKVTQLWTDYGLSDGNNLVLVEHQDMRRRIISE